MNHTWRASGSLMLIRRFSRTGAKVGGEWCAGPPHESYISAMSAPEELPTPRYDRLPVRVFRLGEEPSDDLSDSTTPEERFEMVARLTERMLEFYPSLPHSNLRRGTPVRVIRP